MAKVMAGSGSLTYRILYRRSLVAQRIAREGVFELGHGAHVAGMQFVDGNRSFALHDREVGKLFGRVAGEVLHRGVIVARPKIL